MHRSVDSQGLVVGIPVTAIVLTHNEAINIQLCLRALDSVDDVVLLDSGSTDETLDLAWRTRKNLRVFHNPFQDFGHQRNWALEHCHPCHPWVLFVDADEYCSSALLEEISAFIRHPGEFVGAFIAGRNYFLGRWLRYSTMYPSYQLRLLRLGAVHFRKEGHGQKEISDGPFHYLREGWRHEGFSHGVAQWITRHNRYSSSETELILRLREEPLEWKDFFSSKPIIRRRAGKRLGAKLPFRPLTRFIYTYFLCRGFLDGVPGLMYCLLRVAHDIHIIVKLREQQYLISNR